MRKVLAIAFNPFPVPESVARFWTKEPNTKKDDEIGDVTGKSSATPFVCRAALTLLLDVPNPFSESPLLVTRPHSPAELGAGKQG